MSRWPSHLFNVAAANLEAGSIAAAIRAAHASQDNGLPAILTLNHLARHVDLPYRYLRSLVERQRDPYRSFQIRKRRGGFRVIVVPENDLMRTHRWISQHILNKCRPHSASYAYEPGKSLLECARQHVGARWLIKVDVRQFFESISEVQVWRVFRSCGYGRLVSFEMARLVTRELSPLSMRRRQKNWMVRTPGAYFGIPWYRQKTLGHLPQDAPTSPMLSNLSMRQFDKDISEIAITFGTTFTRYSDDLILSSSSTSFSREKAKNLIGKIYRRMNLEGLRPHQSKTVISPPGARKIALGLLVDGERPRLRPEFKRMLECHTHFLKRFGPSEHSKKRGFASVLGFRRHFEGKIAFAEYVDPDFATSLRKRLVDLSWPA